MGFIALGNVNLNQLHRFVLDGDTLDIYSPDYIAQASTAVTLQLSDDDSVQNEVNNDAEV